MKANGLACTIRRIRRGKKPWDVGSAKHTTKISAAVGAEVNGAVDPSRFPKPYESHPLPGA